jgi:hypothetical protein
MIQRRATIADQPSRAADLLPNGFRHWFSRRDQIFGAIKVEFDKYGDVVGALVRQLNTASNSVENLGRRTRAMSGKLKSVEAARSGGYSVRCFLRLKVLLNPSHWRIDAVAADRDI